MHRYRHFPNLFGSIYFLQKGFEAFLVKKAKQDKLNLEQVALLYKGTNCFKTLLKFLVCSL
jgi:hypothetical protein